MKKEILETSNGTRTNFHLFKVMKNLENKQSNNN